MKVSLNWIKEFSDVKLTVDQLVEKIGAQLGAVEEVVDLGKKYQGIVIAKVVSCAKHPDADKLQVCTIDDGGSTPSVNRDNQGYVQVVCGAPNVREGMLAAWLPPGSTVPSSYDKEHFVLEAREIRGVVSNGMLASSHELALSDDHSGIVELSYGEPGADFAKEFGLDDYIIDIENKMFTHRPDLFGILGLAREIAGITGQHFKSPEWYAEEPDHPVAESKLKVTINNQIPEQVPRFMAQVIEGVAVKTSPAWMQAYLNRAGIRPINNIVDVTNYVMFLTAQPLHAYDYDKLAAAAGVKGNGQVSLETRLSRKGDKLKLLNGKTVTFEDDETILITSNEVPVGIGGVMGGADTEVDETTKNIVLECANFDMYAIRRASMRHGLFTDAVTRFNKGQSSLQTAAVICKSAGWITFLAGGMAGETVENYQKKEHPATLQATTEFINDRLGLKLAADKMAMLLKNVEFTVDAKDDELTVTAPFWRTDIEIPEDVVEEVGRLYGYDHLPLELPKRDLTPAKKNELLELKQHIRETLAKAGANEVLTYSFVHGNLIEKSGQDKTKAFQLSNALSPDLQYYRMSLTPSLADKVHANIKAGYDEFALFEIGKAHIKGEQDAAEPDVPKEVNALSLVFAADEKAAKQYGGAPYYQAHKYVSQLLKSFGATDMVRLEPLAEADLYKNPWLEQMAAPFEPKRSAVLRDIKGVFPGTKGLIWGVVGEFKTSVRKSLKLPEYSAGFEVDPLLFSSTAQANNYVPLSRFPKVAQDITLKVPADTSYQTVHEVLFEQLLSQEKTYATLEPLDIYQRDDDKEHKQISFRFIIAHYEKTLKSEEVNAMLDRAAKSARDTLGAERI